MSSNYVKNPGNLQNLFNQIKDKKLSPVDLINSYINRINDTQKDIEQWKSYDFEKAIEIAVSHSMKAIITTSIILVCGFSFIALSEFPGNVMFAILSCVIILDALVVDLIFTPAMLTVLKPDSNP